MPLSCLRTLRPLLPPPPHAALLSVFKACAAPEPSVTPSPNTTMVPSDYPHSPTASMAHSLSFPHPPTWGATLALSPSIPDNEWQRANLLVLVPDRTSNFTPSGFRLPGSNLSTDILFIPEPTNIPSVGSYVDPYAGVILAASCPTGCPRTVTHHSPNTREALRWPMSTCRSRVLNPQPSLVQVSNRSPATAYSETLPLCRHPSV